MAKKTLRLVLGDQLNSEHSWYTQVDPTVTYVMMEVKAETSQVHHHIQKLLGFFGAMRAFNRHLLEQGHRVLYLNISDQNNQQNFYDNLLSLIQQHSFQAFEYQEPDDFHLDQTLQQLSTNLSIPVKVYPTEHFLTQRYEVKEFFSGKKTFVMENFYRYIRKKEDILMDGEKPMHGKWNFDHDNRQKIPRHHRIPPTYVLDQSVVDIFEQIQAAGIQTIGHVDPQHFVWPLNRTQSLDLLDAFLENALPFFGTFQDAMPTGEWSVYHSRLSFSLNTKMISPKEVVDKTLAYYKKHTQEISFNQVEGFVRQIIGWREYMRGMYWMHMPEFEQLNFFQYKNPLPKWYWTAQTKMNCLKQCIGQSLNKAYAHHIQRLMVTGNFALLAGIDPSEVDAWYLGIYIDALQWVEITNTRGMSQFADGGIIATKPYVSSAAYIHKMSDYCTSCHYNKAEKVGEKACPFNSLYWNFYAQNEGLLKNNPRTNMPYTIWNKMQSDLKKAILDQADFYLKNVDTL